MITFALRRYVFSVTAACAVLAGCGGSQPPIGAPGATPITRGVVAHGASRASGDLLYLSDSGFDGSGAFVQVYTYPQGKHVATLTGFDRLSGECSDANGDVFMVAPAEASSDPTIVYEYAHGGSTPIAALTEPGQGFGCAVDPSTGNLASWSIRNTSQRLIMLGSTRTHREAPDFTAMEASGFRSADTTSRGIFSLTPWATRRSPFLFAELPKGAAKFSPITLNEDIEGVLPGRVQWDGQYMAFHTYLGRKDTIYRVAVSGSSGTIIGTVKLLSVGLYPGGWIEGTSVIGLHGRRSGNIAIWNYSVGGKPVQKIPNLLSKNNWFLDVALSPGSHK